MKLLSPEFVHVDERRKLTQLITADIKQINIYEAKKGSNLGDHYHKSTNEFFYILKGGVLYNKDRILGKGDLFAVFPEEKHSIYCLTDVTFMTFLTKAYDNEHPDIFTS